VTREQCLTGRCGGGYDDGDGGGDDDGRQVNYYLVKEEQSLHLVGVLQVCKKSFVSFPLEMIPRPSTDVLVRQPTDRLLSLRSTRPL
jgi:hypothetical protein